MQSSRIFKHPDVSTWFKFLLVIFPVLAIWSLANPMFASPDEPSHMVRAQGIIRGDAKEPYLTDGIPEVVGCMAFNWDITADCMDLTWGAKDELRFSATDTYPPLFHVVAGVPSLFIHGLGGAYAMRLWMALVCGSFFALSATLLWSRRQHFWSIGGLVGALTPMVVFASATVNPSGITSAMASLVWAGGLGVTRPTETTKIALSRWTFVLAAVLFPLLRRDALAWELIVLLILSSTLDRGSFSRLKRDKAMMGSMIVLLMNMIFVWFTWAGTATDSFVSNSASHGGGSWAAGLGSLYTKILEMIGIFGWLDSPMTNEALVMLLCLLFCVLFLAITGGRKDHARTVAVTFAALLASPVLIGLVRYPYVQGRYLLPLWIGCMLIAGQALAESELPRRFLLSIFKIFLFSMAIIQFFAFAQNLRRYAVGRDGTWSFFQHSNWQPPMMSNLTALFLMVVVLSISGLTIRLLIRQSANIS